MKTLKLGTQINLSFIVILFVPMIVATIFSIVYFSWKIRDEAVRKIYSDLKTAELIYQSDVMEVTNFARSYSQKKIITVLIRYRMPEKLGNELKNVAEVDHIDMITIVDPLGKVEVRSHSPKHVHDMFPKKRYIEIALTGNSVGGTEVLSAEEIKNERLNLAEKSLPEDTGFLSITGVAPVQEWNRDQIAAITVARRILNTASTIRTISNNLNLNAAIFKNTDMICSIAANDEKTGFKLPDKTFLKEILEKNTTRHKLSFEKGGHITIGKPLLDFNGVPVGVLSVQMNIDHYIRTRNIAVTTLVIILSTGIFLAFIIKTIIKRRILVPVQRLRKGTELIGSGEYMHKLEVSSLDEIGELTGDFNAMAVKLQSYHASLEQKIQEQKETEKALRKSEKKYRDIFENASEGIFQSTPDGRIMTGNRALSNIFGYGSTEEMMARVKDINTKFFPDAAKRKAFLETLEQDGSVRNFGGRAYQKNGHILYISINAHVVIDEQNGQTYFEGFLEDATQKKRAAELKIAKDAAEATTRSKSEFLANMSHEIRTPMNAIVGLIDLTMKTDLDEKQKDYLGKIKSSSRALLSTINDILDLSKIEAGKLSLEEVDFMLNDIIDNQSNLFSAMLAEKGVDLVFEIAEGVPYALKGDPFRLSQVLTNLTGNAVKFTDCGKVTVKVSLVEKNADRIVLLFSIEDTGIGISSELIPKLFDSFTQADGSTTRRFGGTGLGLSICKNLSELMKGEIRVKSEAGKGSVFSFTAVFGHGSVKIRKEEKTHMSMAETLRRIRGAKVLLVEDNPINQHVAIEILESVGINVGMVTNGKEAVRTISRFNPGEVPFDAVLMDVQMPEMDGYEASRIIREHEKSFCKKIGKSVTNGPHLPIIAITAHAMQGDREKCLYAGMDDYVTKPLESEELFSILAKWIDRSEDHLREKDVFCQKKQASPC